MDRKIRVAFIYKASNIFMTGKHFDNLVYHIFMHALKRNNRIEVSYFQSEDTFDVTKLKDKIDLILLWQNNEFGTPDLLGIKDMDIPVISRCADPREAEETIRYHKKWKIDYYYHFWSEAFFHSFLPKDFKYKSIIFGIEPSLYQNMKPFKQRIKNKIINSGAVGNSKLFSRLINYIRNPKWNAFHMYHLRTIVNQLPYVEYFPTLQNEFVGDKYPLLLEKYQTAIAANTITNVTKMWEIPASGCLCFLEVNDQNHVEEVGFVDGETAVFINEQNYKKKFKEYLSNPDDPKWEKIANAGRKFVLDELNNDKAVNSLVDLMESLLEK